MLSHDDIPTVTVHTDWDFSLIPTLRGIALFFHDEGGWEGLEESAREVLQGSRSSVRSDLYGPLRQCYNAYLTARHTYRLLSHLDDEADDTALSAAEQVLAEELLEFHADPEAYRIVHAVDVACGDEAWFLCFVLDLETLNVLGKYHVDPDKIRMP